VAAKRGRLRRPCVLADLERTNRRRRTGDADGVHGPGGHRRSSKTNNQLSCEHRGQVIAQPGRVGSSGPTKFLRRVLKAFIVVAIIVAAGLAIAQDQETVELRSAVAAEDPGAPEFLSALVAADLVSGNVYDVLVNGDQVYRSMIEAIDQARHRVSFETYVYEKGQVADWFTGALERAASRGVDVRVIVDSVGASKMEDGHVERLRKAGCHVVDFNPSHWYSLEELNYRTHRKILVVDGEVGFTGGIGVADYWIGDAENPAHWRDTHVRMRGPIVRLLEAAFYENFIEGELTVTPALSEATPVEGADDRSMLVRSAPSGGATDLKRLYLLSIAMARRSVEITSPYFLTDESSMWTFKDAIQRGVKIRILVESDITDQKVVKYASREAYESLLELGIEIYEYKPTMMHAKTVVVDGVLSIFGSANFDNRSLELNDELNIAVFNRDLAGRFLKDFENDLRSSERLDLERWRRRPRLQRVQEHFWSYFGEIF
jgi:cardiolipin synthase